MMKWFFILLLFIFPIIAEPNSPEMVYKCSTISRMIEIEEELPPLLLSAVTFIESSDMPWVIGVEGTSHRYYTKQGALEKIKELKTAGKKNFDIGCMQINHFFHKDKFQSEEDMLNPVRNIRYAAKLLKQLKNETGSWEKAVAYYNSRDLKYSATYTNKVYNHWHKIKSMGNLPFELASFANIPKSKTNAILQIPNTLRNTTLQKAKVAYLTYKKTLIRQ
jgi:hypothetical protein